MLQIDKEIKELNTIIRTITYSNTTIKKINIIKYRENITINQI
jgi:hypothetical protein